MKRQSLNRKSPRQRIRDAIQVDPTTLKDARAFKARFGEYPQGMGEKTKRALGL